MMSLIKQFDLITEIEQRHPDGIIKAIRQNLVILFEMGQDFGTPEMVSLLKRYWQTSQNVLCNIDLQGIDVLTPFVARTLVESLLIISAEFKVPVLFSSVGQMARESLDSEICRFAPGKIVWILDRDGKAHLVGRVPGKFQELLGLLQKEGPASASQIAEMLGTTSKKTIGNLSVYLQKLFTTGLLGREKVTALEREKAARGWTYVYQTSPAIFQLHLEQQRMRRQKNGNGITRV